MGAPRPIALGALLVAGACLLLVALLGRSTPVRMSQIVYADSVRSPARGLSRAHSTMLATVGADHKGVFQMLAGCPCNADVSKMMTDGNTWGNYAPKCCSTSADKNSVTNVLATDYSSALTGMQKLKAAMASAKEKMDKKLSVVIDAVTLKNGGRAGKRGVVGPQGPQGYVGAPGIQGERGDAGEFGPKGVEGHPGQIGFRGPTGDDGPQGTQGWEGVDGPPGYIGPPGKRGKTGVMGETGPLGYQGPLGNKGTLGPLGPNGVMGEVGHPGTINRLYGYQVSGDCMTANGRSIAYLDRQKSITCGRVWGNSFLSKLQFGHYSCGSYDLKPKFECLSPARWSTCAKEGGRCQCGKDAMVRYGSNLRWSKAKMGDNVRCDSSTFGVDPFPGVVKECQCAQGSTALGTSNCHREDMSCQYAGHFAYMDRQNIECSNGNLISAIEWTPEGCSSSHMRSRLTCCGIPRGVSDCTGHHTPCAYSEGNMENMDGYAAIQCSEGRALKRIQLTHSGCGGSSRRYYYECCGVNP